MYGQVPDVNAPHWVRIERNGTGTITCYHRADGGQWERLANLGDSYPNPAYAGLAMTSHDSSQVNTTVFSNATLGGAPLTLADVETKEIGVPFNTPAPLYVALKDEAGNEATVTYAGEDPAVASTNIEQWTEWLMPLSEFAGLDLTRITRLTLGVGPEADADPAGVGRMLYDDIRIYNSSRLAPTE
jgi:hypothetical protein